MSILLLVLAHPAHATPVQNAANRGDFRCNCGGNEGAAPDFHRETPEQIKQDCTQQACSSTQIWITLDPQGPFFKGDSNMGTLYQHLWRDTAASATRMAPGFFNTLTARRPLKFVKYNSFKDLEAPGPLVDHDPKDTWAGLAAHAINAHLKPHNIDWKKRDPWIVVVNTDSPYDAQAVLNYFPGDNGLATIVLQEHALLDSSPAALTSNLGHELVHVLQYRRTYKLSDEDLARINVELNHVDELEARAWQKGIYNPGASIWLMPFATQGQRLFHEQTVEEKKKIELAVDCNEWLVRKSIVDMKKEHTRIFRSKWDIFREWMKQNPWAQYGWVPFHPDWENIDETGPEPYGPGTCS